MHDTSLVNLPQGVNILQQELNERTGQLKALAKENFDHSISCINPSRRHLRCMPRASVCGCRLLWSCGRLNGQNSLLDKRPSAGPVRCFCSLYRVFLPCCKLVHPLYVHFMLADKVRQ